MFSWAPVLDPPTDPFKTNEQIFWPLMIKLFPSRVSIVNAGPQAAFGLWVTLSQALVIFFFFKPVFKYPLHQESPSPTPQFADEETKARK